MKGQWMGRYSGTNSTGTILINIDDVGTHYAGHATLYNDNTLTPHVFALIRTQDKGNIFHLCPDLLPVHPHTGEPSAWDQVAPLFAPNIIFPKRADVDLEVNDKTLKVRWFGRDTKNARRGADRIHASAGHQELGQVQDLRKRT
jgi:hypothetical protein